MGGILNKFNCLKCGQCCKEMAICITYSDIIRWKEQNRIDIIKEVSFTRGCPQGDGFYFEKTITAPKKPCPFLQENLCSIHDTKPICCKDAPYGFNNFDVCPEWNNSMIDKRTKKIQARQHKDFKNCVIHFKELLETTIKAKGWRLKVNM